MRCYRVFDKDMNETRIVIRESKMEREHYINVYHNEAFELVPYTTLQQNAMTRAQATDEAVAHGSDYAYTIKVNKLEGKAEFIDLSEKAERIREEEAYDAAIDARHIQQESRTDIFINRGE